MSNARFAAALAALLALGLGPARAASSECRATRAAYGALEHGMSYRRVVAILGCPGRAVTRMRIGKARRATYSWRGTGTYGANLTLSFRNGHLTSKSQLGLK
jgi:hypothetical protein